MAHTTTAWLALLALLALLGHAQEPPAPTPTDPLRLSGGLISETTGVSCDDIFAGDPDSDGTTEQLNCNKASVLVLQVPITETLDNGVTFDFDPNGQSGGGTYHTNPGACDKGPGYCLYGQAFRINIRVSPVATAYDLELMDVVAPFAYTYENCLSLAPASDNTFYPYYAEGTCGIADIWNLDDYKACNSPESWPYWNVPDADAALRPQFATNYSKCAFMCGWELEKRAGMLDTAAGQTLAGWCNDEYEDSNNVQDVVEDYFSPTPGVLACDKATAYTGVVRNLLPNFPRPTGFCPCADAATTMDMDPNSKPQSQQSGSGGSSQPLGPFSSIVACKSCSGAGSCGTALPRPEPTNLSMCDITEDDYDTVCDCVPGIGNTDTDFAPDDDPVNDPNTVCFNTEQRHRCLKCQPSLIDSDNNNNIRNESCAYVDINEYALCMSFWEDVCGGGDYTLSDRQRDTNGNGEKTAASIGLCNCKSNFIERAYWVGPFCAPYRIVNPSKLQYVITVTLLYGGDKNSEQYNKPVPNGTMVVGSGYSPFFDPGDPPGAGNATTQILPWLNATIDGFAVTEIISEYTMSGGLTTALPGAIVMCNDGKVHGAQQPYCGFATLNENSTSPPNPNSVPTANIYTAGRTGMQNPWPNTANITCSPVPLPDFIYNNTNFSGTIDANQGTWWNYLSQDEIFTYGTACGTNGWRLTGPADTASAYTMCSNLQGTCVPGIDLQFRGEAIKPPCSVATDFLNYVDRWMKRTGDSAEVIREKDDPGEVPPHVPPTWNTAQPTYAVHRNKLFRYDDPVVTKQWAAARLRISIAADFAGETIVQAGGTIAADFCTMTTQDGLGLFHVIVQNKGTMAAEYAFIKGPECTGGLDFDTQIFSVSAGEPTKLALSIIATSSYGSQAEPANAQSCSVSIAPSLVQSDILGTTAVISCVPQYGVPQIGPILAANVTYEEGLADSYILSHVNGPGCGFWCSFGNPFQRKAFLTPFEWEVVTFFLTILLFVVTLGGILCCGQQVTATANEKLAYSKTVAEKARQIRTEIVASSNG